VRIDQLLVQRGHAASRSQAQRLVAAGVGWRLPMPAGNPWLAAGKSGDDVPEHAELQLTDTRESRYVSRGGLKLEGALAAAGVVPSGKQCLDVGQSTGGFTDCLLQAGAAHVVGVDVGHGQLHPSLRADHRVTCIEKFNARALTASALANLSNPAQTPRIGPAPPDTARPVAVNPASGTNSANDSACTDGAHDSGFALIVGDLSFISQTLVLPALVPLLDRDGDLLMLVKPQFELQVADIGKGGLVRDPALYARVEQRLRAACAELALSVVGWFDSPITGGDGNREFFIHARHYRV
jgi:23S rRNA (cytidine1920-2'-O)/16S rRNA (cytidine1409-2'-O)-methyltransferase